MPTGFSILNTNTSDTDTCVSIGQGTAGRHLKTSSGVAIGQTIYGASHTSDLDLDNGVLIGKNVFPIAGVNGLSSDTVAIGRNICTSTYNQTVDDSVIIGAESCTNLEEGKTVAVGAHVLKNATNVANYVTAVGFGCAQDCTSVGTGAVIIGRNACRNNSSGAFTIGSNAIVIGSGPVDGHTAPTSDSVTIGRDVCVDSATTTGQIKIGTQSVHNTFTADVDQSIKLITDSLVNLEGTPTSTTISATDASTSHSVRLRCGNNKTLSLNNVGLTLNCPIMLPDGIICSADGKSYMRDGSYWASGSALDGTELRHVIVGHPNFGIDSSHHSVVQAPYGVSVTTGSTIDPLNSLSTTKDDYSLYMSRLSAHANEMHIMLPSIAEGWQVIRYKVLANVRQNNTTSPPLLLNARSVFYSRTMANTGTSNRANAYVSSHVDATNGTNVFVSLNTPFVGSKDFFGVIFLPFTSADSMVLACILEIERV